MFVILGFPDKLSSRKKRSNSSISNFCFAVLHVRVYGSFHKKVTSARLWDYRKTQRKLWLSSLVGRCCNFIKKLLTNPSMLQRLLRNSVRAQLHRLLANLSLLGDSKDIRLPKTRSKVSSSSSTGGTHVYRTNDALSLLRCIICFEVIHMRLNRGLKANVTLAGSSKTMGP